MSDSEPAHKKMIEKYLDWNLVNERLKKYPNIGRLYSLETFKYFENKEPYYCHYLALSLGTWEDEEWFTQIDMLLGHSMSLKNWNNHRNPKDEKFPKFWSLLWELQVAKFFSDLTNKNVEWTTSGPDLIVNFNGQDLYVECYTYHKSFGIMAFIEAILGPINNNDIHVHHSSYLPVKIPNNNYQEIESFLDKIFQPFLDPIFLKTKRQESEKEYPIILYHNNVQNLYVYLDGDNTDNYITGIIPTGAGIPEKYLEVAIKEAVKNKCDSNRLSEHRPNLLAVNFLLSSDFQSAISRQSSIEGSIPFPNLGSSLDSVLLAACGINEISSIQPRLLYINPLCTWRI